MHPPRQNMQRITFCLFLFLCCFDLKAEQWETYTNPRFGFSFEYPASFKLGREPGNHSGRYIDSKDGKFWIFAVSHFLMFSPLDESWKMSLKAYGDTITYKYKTPTWFVICTNYKNQNLCYKFFASTETGTYSYIKVGYPKAMEKKYAPIAKRIFKSYQPFPKDSFGYDGSFAPGKGWDLYKNDRFGFSFEYPASFIRGEETRNESGISVQSKDGNFQINAESHFLSQNPLDKAWNDALKEYGHSITHKEKTETDFLITANQNGRKFYYAFYTNKDGGTYSSIKISYPLSMEKEYAQTEKDVVKSYEPFHKTDLLGRLQEF